MDANRMTRSIFWMNTLSVIATVFYTMVLTHIGRDPNLQPKWIEVPFVTGFFIWGSVHCDAQSGRLNRFASYGASIAAVYMSFTFLLIAYSILLGPNTHLYRAMLLRADAR
jgi:hypothetical protein